MLSAGYAPLSWLKAQVMPDAGDEETEWDDKLAAIGLAVAKRFEGHCARIFERGTDVEDSFSAFARAWTLRRYPVESISAIDIIETDGTEDPLTITSFKLDANSGVVEYYGLCGATMQSVRFTYTGGFWLDPDDGTELPSGATVLPDDIMQAWVTQVQHVCEVRGIFGDVAMRKEGGLGGLGLLADVQEVLRPYRRFSGE